MKKKTNGFRKVLAGILTFALCAGVAGFGNIRETTANDETTDAVPSNPVYDEETDTTVWDYVYFGNYPQTMITGDALTVDMINAEYNEDGDAVVDGEKIRRMSKQDANYTSRTTAEGFFDWNSVDDGYVYFKYEPIKWRVLQNEGDTLFLLSDTVLDCQWYERSDSKITWETCSIRNWLNGYFPYTNIGWSFMNTGFTKEEQAAIATSNLSNPNNPFHGTNGGSDTQDKIFFMSVAEMTNEAYGFPEDYMTFSSTRQLCASDYAKAMGVWMGSRNGLYDDKAIWMLRTPGSYQQTISLVYWFGHVYEDGYYAQTAYYGVAPALRVDISSDLWKYAGRGDEVSESVSMSNGALDSSITNKVTDSASLSRVFAATGFDLSDAREALTIALGIKEGTAAEIEAYDLEDDGKVSLQEVHEILCIALGIKEWTSEPPKNTDTPDSTSEPQDTQKPEVTPDLTPSPTSPVATAVPTDEPLVQKTCEPSGKIWIAGDSIADYHSKSGYSQPLYGWGELIGGYFENNRTLRFTNNLRSDELYFNEAEEKGGYSTYLINTALSSRSSKSFTNENNYTSITKLMGEGDYLLISFGHNDERADVALYTDPFGSSSDERSFKWYLKNYYIDPAIRAGVQPVLISPVPRRYFYNGEFINPQLHTPYGKAMKELAEEYAQQGITVYYIDLHSYMLDMYEELGEEGTIPLHGKYGNTMDNTHLSQKGATIVSEYIVSQMKAQNMSISKFINE